MKTLPTRYLVTCTGCAESATIRPITGDEVPMFIQAHHHPTGVIVVRTIFLLPSTLDHAA